MRHAIFDKVFLSYKTKLTFSASVIVSSSTPILNYFCLIDETCLLGLRCEKLREFLFCQNSESNVFLLKIVGGLGVGIDSDTWPIADGARGDS
jgi:hypothetical protein